MNTGQYEATAPTVLDKDTHTIQIDVNGNTKVTQATQIAGEDITNDVLKVEHRYSYARILGTAATTVDTVVKSAAGFLHTITVATTSIGTVTVYDNTAGSGTVVALFPASVGENTFTLDVSLSTGITISTTDASDLTVSYR